MESTALKRRDRVSRPAPPRKDVPIGLAKLPPQDIPLEETVIGAILLERDGLTAVIDFLKPHHFYSPQLAAVYEAVVDLFANSEPVDMRTVVARLRKLGTIDLVGGAYYIAELTSRVSSAANVAFHARIIVEHAIKREIIAITGRLNQDAYEDTADAFELLDAAEQAIFSIGDQNLRKSYEGMTNLMLTAIQNLSSREQGPGLTGTPSGLSELDRITDGWQKSDLIIIAARPGMGKTAFVISVMRNAAIEYKVPVALFSLEMAALQLVHRLIATETELDLERIKKGDLTGDEYAQLSAKTSRLTSAPIFIDDTPALSILELRAKCRRLKAEHDIQLVVVDYLQLMQGDRNGNREQEISSISRALKAIAKELNVPVLALSQLSRAVETRGGDKRPQLADLRESGSIEQDADLVLFLYRPEYYKITVDEDGFPTVGMAELIIAKHRNGATGSVKLKFAGRYSKFSDFVAESFAPMPFQRRLEITSTDLPTTAPPGEDENPF